LSQSELDKATPMMAVYQRIKAENPEALLFFRLGDFYEMFGDDAKEAAGLLDITLTARSAGEGRSQKIPMCGVPYHAAETYIARLLKAGRKVAIVEQMEDPRKAKGMVKRELVRIITPGTLLEPNSLEAKQNNYLAALAVSADGWGLAAADVSTGEFLVTEFSGPRALEDLFLELNRLRPAEILAPDDLAAALTEKLTQLDYAYLTRLEGFRFDPDAGRIRLLEHFHLASLEGFGVGGYGIGLGAAAAALHYLQETQRGALTHIRKITPYALASHMALDAATLRNLDLLRNSFDGSRHHTLLETLDFTATAMGGRRLQRWLLRPLLSLEAILARQAAVAEFSASTRLRQDTYAVLKAMHDLERLAGRVGSNTANGRDLVALAASLALLPELKAALGKTQAEILALTARDLPVCSEVRDLLARALEDEPPVSIKEGGLIRAGYHAEVDELRSLSRQGKSFIAELQARERERTGIASLKVEYNSVFGYYIEVTKANAKLVPGDYQRKQTLVNAERYITPELKEYENKVLTAEERLMALELELFLELRARVAGRLPDILLAAERVADIDVLLALAEAASRYNYIRPQVDGGDRLNIREGRHPVVERLTREKFVPNDLCLDRSEQQVIILTGPNMSGKSTYLRQTALIVVLAQMGGFVPAAEAQIGIVDRVFTRVGAADNLAGGQSTFMVEMNEAANILNNATARSLVILDEVGRGTSTFDGVSIAWSVVEHLHDRIGAKTLFATHYYELTELALSKPRVKNFNIAVREWKDDILFLRKILPGASDRSYGIQVARLAGLPEEVIGRAREVLANLERANYTESGNSRLAQHAAGEAAAPQLGLFEDGRQQAVMAELQKLSPETLTPLEALVLLAELKKKLQG
jgi:DNA mismatch repair protein MutS